MALTLTIAGCLPWNRCLTSTQLMAPPLTPPLTLPLTHAPRVLAVEPVPHFRAFLEYSIALNNLQHLVTVLPNVVSGTSLTPPGEGLRSLGCMW